MPKVILHNLTHPFSSFNPEIFDFDQGGIFFAEKGDIVVTRKQISPAYLNFLKSIGFDFKGIDFFWSQEKLNDFDSIFEDKDLVGCIKPKIPAAEQVRYGAGKNPEDYHLDVYVPGILEKGFADALGINFYHNPDHFHQWGKKSFFKKLARNLNISVACGLEDIKSKTDFLLAGLKIFKDFKTQYAVVKQNINAGGLGAKILNRKDFFNSFWDFENFKENLIKQGFNPELDNSFILEKWFDDSVFSLTAYFEITGKKEIRFLFIGQQLVGQSQMDTQGLVSWQAIPSDIRKKAIKESNVIAKWLCDNDFYGVFSLDAVLLQDSSLIWTDFNPRKGLSLYPYKIYEKVTGSDPEYYYKAITVQYDVLKGLDIERFLEKFKSLLFNKKTKTGIVPYGYNLLSSCGRIRILILSKQEQGIKALEEQMFSL